MSWDRLTTRAALAGMVTGTLVYVALLTAGHPEPWDIHAGVVALLVNVAVCVAVTRFDPRPVRGRPEHRPLTRAVHANAPPPVNGSDIAKLLHGVGHGADGATPAVAATSRRGR